MTGPLQALAAELVASGAATAASAIVGRGSEVVARAVAGHRDAETPLRPTDRFDLASLTKPWVGTLALRLAASGELPLASVVGDHWPDAPSELASRPLADLLRHRSGLIAWRPFYRQSRNPRRAAERILSPDSCGARRPTYSDLGYILWARTAERAMGRSLETLLRRQVLEPLGLSTVETRPDPGLSVAARGLGNEREVELAAALGVAVARRPGPPPGVPQDGNARHLGGLPGHAGLFAPADAVWRLAVEWLRPRRLLAPEATAAALAGRGPYGLGWWRPTAARGATRGLSPRSFGHHGFTGGSVWIDPDRELIAVLLAQRTAVAMDLDPWRRRFHALADSLR